MQKPIKLHDLLEALDAGDGATWYFDRHTGQVVMVSDEDFALIEDDVDDDNILDGQRPQLELVRAIEQDTEKQRFLLLPDQQDVHEWDIMQRFATGLDDAQASEALQQSIRGRGAFRSFKDKLVKLGLLDQWYVYREAEYRRFALDWCESIELTWVE